MQLVHSGVDSLIAEGQSREFYRCIFMSVTLTSKWTYNSLLISSFISLFVGYYGIRYFYDAAGADTGAPERLIDTDGGEGMATLSISFLLIVFCMFLTGCGGNSGLCAGINATAKSFSDKTVCFPVVLCVLNFDCHLF